jgi:hypothetical protein
MQRHRPRVSPCARGIVIMATMLIAPADCPKTADIRRVATECVDFVTHPLERGQMVMQSVVPRGRERFAADVDSAQPTEDSQAIVDGEDRRGGPVDLDPPATKRHLARLVAMPVRTSIISMLAFRSSQPNDFGLEPFVQNGRPDTDRGQ